MTHTRKPSSTGTPALSEHLPEGVVLIDQFLQTIVVGVQLKPDDPAHEDRPERHPGAPCSFVDLRRYV